MIAGKVKKQVLSGILLVDSVLGETYHLDALLRHFVEPYL